jgi:serine/threonine kinase 38
MITDTEVRLGRNGAEEIKAHPFFNGFEWSGIRQRKAPYQPKVQSEISNENFDHFEEEEPSEALKK